MSGTSVLETCDPGSSLWTRGTYVVGACIQRPSLIASLPSLAIFSRIVAKFFSAKGRTLRHRALRKSDCLVSVFFCMDAFESYQPLPLGHNHVKAALAISPIMCSRNASEPWIDGSWLTTKVGLTCPIIRIIARP